MDSHVLLDVRFRVMRTGIEFAVSPTDRRRLEAVISAPSSPQKHVWRARIILLSGDGLGTGAIMAAAGVSKTCVWRWQARFMAEGVDGLLREKTRPPGIPKTAPDKAAEVIRLTQGPPPPDATHWTLRAMAKAVGLAASTARKIWGARPLAGAWSCAAPLAAVQAVQRQGFCRKAARCCRALCGTSRPCGGAVCRRAVANTGP